MVQTQASQADNARHYAANHQQKLRALQDSNNDLNNDVTLIFGLTDKVGALASALKFFQDHNISLKHIESRSSRRVPNSYEFLVVLPTNEFEQNKNYIDLSAMIADLKLEASYVELIKCEAHKPDDGPVDIVNNSKQIVNNDNAICDDVCSTKANIRKTSTAVVAQEHTVIGFPRRIRDLDEFRNNVLSYGSELDADHPGFKDKEYRERRKYFADIAYNYRHGDLIPRVEYTKREIQTWSTVYDKISELYVRYACKEYNHIFPLMVQNCGFRRDNIPQLEDVSRFLKDSTGFTLRPVAGLLSSRDFLNGLAYRVFHSTQYIRHHDNPMYTPEPDICHELLGHAPLFADQDFARFSQEIGLASLGAPQEYIDKLATCYWFTIEFGLCKQNNQIKAYGAGLLSSFGELEYAMSGKPEIRSFEPEKTGEQKYPITQYQPVYYIAESFADAQAKLHDYAMKIPRPYVFKYNPYTQSVETLDSPNQLAATCNELKSELALVVDSLKALSAR